MTGLKRYLGYWERNHVLDAINSAGMSFASIYELLPIQTSQYCQSQKPSLVKVANAVVGDDGKPVNLFDVNTWQKYDLLQRIGASAIRNTYYETKLAPLLRQTELLLCDIVDFDPSTIADVTYLFGREKDDRTYGWFKLRSGAPESIEDFTNVHGDGTVPIYSAQNQPFSKTSQTREVSADHTTIISHPELRSIIETWYEEALVRSKAEVGRSGTKFGTLTVTEIAASGNLLPVSLNALEWAGSDYKFVVDSNKKALDLMGYSPSDVAQFASQRLDPLERAKLYAVAAASTEVKSEKFSWLLETAKVAYLSSNFDDAIGTSNFITTGSNAVDSGVNNANTVSTVKLAKEINGWAHLRQGEIEKFSNLATDYANTYGNELKEPSDPILREAISRNYVLGRQSTSFDWAQPSSGFFENGNQVQSNWPQVRRLNPKEARSLATCEQVISCGTKDGKRKEYPTPCAARDDGATNITPKTGPTCEVATK